jgi:hypothetical protein
MTIQGTLPLRLSVQGCKIVGTQFAAVLDSLRQEITLPKDVEVAASSVEESSRAIRQLTDGGDMRLVDRPTDTAVAAFDDALESRENAYVGEEILPLTDEQKDERELASKLRRRLLSDGTIFVTLSFRQQWARMEKLDRDLAASLPELDRLGLAQQSLRLRAWIALYGQRLGITHSALAADAEAQAVARWHDAWQELVDVVRGLLLRKDPATAGRLLSPYDEQAQAERQARRGKRKA